MKNIYKKIHEAKLEIGKVTKNAKNPHFKQNYADLNALIEAVEPILISKGLILLQPIKDGIITTQIIDFESGESVESSMVLPIGGTPQGMGSAITYYRRYTLQSLMSLMTEDDDGNGAEKMKQPEPKKAITDKAFGQAIERIIAGEHDLIAKLKEAYLLSPAQAVELSEIFK